MSRRALALASCVLAGASLGSAASLADATSAGAGAGTGAASRAVAPPGWSVRRDPTTGRVRSAARFPSAGAARAIGSIQAASRDVLAEWAPALGLAPDLSDLSVKYERQGLARHVVVYEQRIDGLPVLGGEIAVTFAKGQPVMLASGYHPAPRGAAPGEGGPAAAAAPAAGLGAGAAIARVRDEIARASGKAPREESGASDLFAPRAAACWFPTESGELRRAFEVFLPLADPRGEWRGIVDAASGEVLLVEDNARYARAAVPDTATGRVFNPNPVVTLQNTNLCDLSDTDQAALSGAYTNVQLLDVEFYDSEFHLEGPHVRVMDLASPTIPPPTSATGDFTYTRADDAFEAVSAYYHIDRAQRYVQSLGFSNVANFQLRVDPHGFGDADNSVYSPGAKTIRFGDGCVDDAEDADVICHEYGHAIQDDQVPGFGANTSARSLGEGFGDYWSSSVTTQVGGGYADSAQVFDWDMNPGPGCACWNGRRVDEFRTMAQYGGDIYQNGKIWSGALWQIRSAVGAAVADRLVIESHFGLSSGATFEENARSYIIADSTLYGGVHSAPILNAFEERQIFPDLNAPDLTLGILQNPVLTAYIDIVVVSSEALDTTAVSGAVNATPVTFRKQDIAARLFRGEHHLAAPGAITVSFTGHDLAGNQTDVSRGFTAAKTAGGLATVVTSPDGLLVARVAAGAFPDGTWLLLGAAEDPEGPGKSEATLPGGAYLMGPVGARPREPVEITLAPAPGAALDGLRLVLLETGDPLETWLDPESGALVASLPVLGTVALRPGGGTTPPLDRAFLALGPAVPNPTHGPTRIAFEVRAPQSVTLAVYSVTGQRVRALTRGHVPPGGVQVDWDGRDDDGRLVGSGVYFLRLEGDRAAATRKVTVLR